MCYHICLRYQPYGCGDSLEQLGKELDNIESCKSPSHNGDCGQTEIDPLTPILPDNQLGMEDFEDTPRSVDDVAYAGESPCTAIVLYTGPPSTSPPPESWFVMLIANLWHAQWREWCSKTNPCPCRLIPARAFWGAGGHLSWWSHGLNSAHLATHTRWPNGQNSCHGLTAMQ